MLTIFNTNELRHAEEITKLQGDEQYIPENSPRCSGAHKTYLKTGTCIWLFVFNWRR